jgi:hypothetical protein
MAATWLALFHYLAMNERLLAGNTTVAFFARERRRALIGIATHLIAGLAALWEPVAGLVVAATLPVFYGATSEGLPRTRPARDITTSPGVVAMTATGTLEAGRGLAPKSARGPCCSPP